MARRVYTEDEKAEALRIYQEHGPSAAARETGIPKGTIAAWARRGGVRTSAPQNMREANEAQSENFKARRHAIITQLYDLAEADIAQLKQPGTYQTIMKGPMGVEEVKTPGFIPAQDKQREYTALGIALDKATTLENFDAGSQDHNAVDAWLAHVMGGND